MKLVEEVNYTALRKWWREVDSNHRRRKPADLQSAPVGRLGIPPKFWACSNRSGPRRSCVAFKIPAPTPRTRRCSTTSGFRQFASQRLRIFAARRAQVNRLRGTGRPLIQIVAPPLPDRLPFARQMVAQKLRAMATRTRVFTLPLKPRSVTLVWRCASHIRNCYARAGWHGFCSLPDLTRCGTGIKSHFTILLGGNNPMNLKITLLASALATACGALTLAPAANAADGTITFNGKVIAPTCSVSNASGGNLSVNLPTVLATAFSGLGSTAGQTSFKLNLTGCPTSPSGIQVAAEFSGTNINSTDGNLNNAAAGGSNVEVQLTDGAGTAINLGTTPAHVTATVDGSGNATLDYKAQYYAAQASVSGGAVQTSVEYTLTYQ